MLLNSQVGVKRAQQSSSITPLTSFVRVTLFGQDPETGVKNATRDAQAVSKRIAEVIGTVDMSVAEIEVFEGVMIQDFFETR